MAEPEDDNLVRAGFVLLLEHPDALEHTLLHILSVREIVRLRCVSQSFRRASRRVINDARCLRNASLRVLLDMRAPSQAISTCLTGDAGYT